MFKMKQFKNVPAKVTQYMTRERRHAPAAPGQHLITASIPVSAVPQPSTVQQETDNGTVETVQVAQLNVASPREPASAEGAAQHPQPVAATYRSDASKFSV